MCAVSRVGGLCVLSFIVGCGAPKGDPGGRVEVHRTTPAERRAPGMVVADMASASDQIAQSLISDLNGIVEKQFRDPSVRAWVVFGAIENKSYTMPRTDFEYIRELVKDKLQKSALWRDNIKFVAQRKAVEQQNREEFDEDDRDPLQREPGREGVERPSKEHMYYLNGKAYGVLRGSTEDYYLSFNLTRASDGEEIFSHSYEMKYTKRDH